MKNIFTKQKKRYSNKKSGILIQTKTYNSFEKNFKMTSSISITNIYLFNKDEKLVNYKSINDIVDDFIITRWLKFVICVNKINYPFYKV